MDVGSIMLMMNKTLTTVPYMFNLPEEILLRVASIIGCANVRSFARFLPPVTPLLLLLLLSSRAGMIYECNVSKYQL